MVETTLVLMYSGQDVSPLCSCCVSAIGGHRSGFESLSLSLAPFGSFSRILNFCGSVATAAKSKSLRSAAPCDTRIVVENICIVINHKMVICNIKCTFIMHNISRKISYDGRCNSLNTNIESNSDIARSMSHREVTKCQISGCFGSSN